MSADMIDVPAKGETRVLREAIRKCLSAENEGSFDKIYENADHPERGYVEEEFVLEDAHGEPHFYAVYCTQVNDGLKSSYVMFARNIDELNAKRVVLTKNKEQKMIALIEEQNEALKVARRSDVIVAALGESSEMSGESSSRSDISIPDVQKTLLKELLKLGKPVVLVLFDGRPLTIE